MLDKNMNSSKDNQSKEDKKNRKALLLLLLALLVIVICAIIIPVSLNKKAKTPEVAITDEVTPLVDKVESTTKEDNKTNTEAEPKEEIPAEVNIPEDETPLAAAPVVQPVTPVVPTVADLTQDVQQVIDLVEATNTPELVAPVTPEASPVPVTPSTDVEDEIDELQRELEAAREKEQKLNTLVAKLQALRNDYVSLHSQNITEAKEYISLLGELGETTNDYIETMTTLNEKLETVKKDAIVCAQASVAGIAALEEALEDKDSAISAYFNEGSRKNKNGEAIDSTGKNWALGETAKAKDGVNSQLVDAISNNNQISDEVKQVVIGEDEVVYDADMNIVEDNTTGLPVKASSDVKKDTPEVAYKVIQVAQNKKTTGYDILWTTDFDHEEGETINAYYLSADNKLYVCETKKDGENKDLTNGGRILADKDEMSLTAVIDTDNTNSEEPTKSDLEIASEVLGEMTSNTFDATMIADCNEVIEVAKEEEQEIFEERDKLVIEYANEAGITVEDASKVVEFPTTNEQN